MSDKPTIGRGGRFFSSNWNSGEEKADFATRLSEAQQRYDMLKPGEHMPCDLDLMPYINRTDKCVVVFSDEVTDFPRTEKR